MRTLAALAFLLLAACGGTTAQCEQVELITGPDGHQVFRITCIHECGMVLNTWAWIPGPSCEWESSVCKDRCAHP